MNDFKKTQWHPPFCAAVKLELRANKKDLSFESEYTLNTKPIQIDLLVIKKLQNVIIENEIGKIFRGHNIFEYKSPEDALGIDEYFKTLSYACLYKANSASEDGIPSSDVTVSLVREGMPRTLYRWFQSEGCSITEKYPGIYYISGEKTLFPTQLIVSSMLNVDEHHWLKALTSHMNETTGEKLVLSASKLTEKDDKLNAESVLHLARAENEPLFNRLKEENNMYPTLMDLMKPEFDAALDKAVNEAVDKAVNEAVDKSVEELSSAMKRLKAGETTQDLLDANFNPKIIKSAADLLNEISK